MKALLWIVGVQGDGYREQQLIDRGFFALIEIRSGHLFSWVLNRVTGERECDEMRERLFLAWLFVPEGVFRRHTERSLLDVNPVTERRRREH